MDVRTHVGYHFFVPIIYVSTLSPHFLFFRQDFIRSRHPLPGSPPFFLIFFNPSPLLLFIFFQSYCCKLSFTIHFLISFNISFFIHFFSHSSLSRFFLSVADTPLSRFITFGSHQRCTAAASLICNSFLTLHIYLPPFLHLCSSLPPSGIIGTDFYFPPLFMAAEDTLTEVVIEIYSLFSSPR